MKNPNIKYIWWGRRLKAQNVRLRSANRGNANNDWNVNTTGNANNNNANNANRPAPDCINIQPVWSVRKTDTAKRMTQGAEIPALMGKTIFL